MKKIHLLFLLLALNSCFTQAQYSEKDKAPDVPLIDHLAKPFPDRIFLSFSNQEADSYVVTWRTNTSITKAKAQIALASASVDFYKKPTEVEVSSVKEKNIDEEVLYHQVTFDALLPDTSYAYRVGSDQGWSEWNTFHTQEEQFTKPFEFIYLADAQNDVYALWSRVIRSAYSKAPQARFMLHAGDLINHAESNYEWGEWFAAGGFLFKQIPQLAVAGNHEYVKNKEKKKTHLTTLWKPQFEFPKNGMEGLEDTNYYFDYLNCRIIVLNSNEKIDQQAAWLEDVLEKNDKKWVIVSFHHPIISAARGRVNEGILKNWKPILDKYKVDLVLQGHDHVYGRGNQVDSGLNQWNENSGTVYVVSLAGRKTYELSDHSWMQKKLQGKQLYQIIRVEEDKITFEAYTAGDKLFDAFEITKKEGDINEFKDLLE